MARAAKKEKQLVLDADPRWPAFVQRYAFEQYKFAVEVCGMGIVGKPVTHQQKELFDEASPYGCRVSVASVTVLARLGVLAS